MKNLLSWLKSILCPKDSLSVTNEMDKANIKNVNSISLVVIVYELFTYLFVATGLVQVRNIKESTMSVAFVVLFCLFFYFYSERAKNYEFVSHIKITVVTVIAFSILTAYSIYLSYNHYIYGKDIITFYIVMVTYAAFIIIKPYISLILLSVSFTVCYIVLVHFDGAPSIHILNFFAFACICIVASSAKYHLMRKQQLGRQKVASLNSALERAVRYDVLTKLKNRYALIEDSVNYYNKHLYLVMCDCDNFKHINDTYGHIVGDRVIASIADVFKANIDEKYIYRYGGDEFLIVNICLNNYDFEALKNKIHNDLDSLKIEGVAEGLTCFFGRARGTPENGEAFEDLIQRADRNMYKEKQLKRKSDYRAKPSKGGDAKQGV